MLYILLCLYCLGAGTLEAAKLSSYAVVAFNKKHGISFLRKDSKALMSSVLRTFEQGLDLFEQAPPESKDIFAQYIEQFNRDIWQGITHIHNHFSVAKEDADALLQLTVKRLEHISSRGTAFFGSQSAHCFNSCRSVIILLEQCMRALTNEQDQEKFGPLDGELQGSIFKSLLTALEERRRPEIPENTVNLILYYACKDATAQKALGGLPEVTKLSKITPQDQKRFVRVLRLFNLALTRFLRKRTATAHFLLPLTDYENPKAGDVTCCLSGCQNRLLLAFCGLVSAEATESWTDVRTGPYDRNVAGCSKRTWAIN